MKFLFAVILCLGCFSWADEEVTVGTPDTASMRIGEGDQPQGQPIVQGIDCPACRAHALSQNIHTKGASSNPATKAAGNPAGGDTATDGAAER